MWYEMIRAVLQLKVSINAGETILFVVNILFY